MDGTSTRCDLLSAASVLTGAPSGRIEPQVGRLAESLDCRACKGSGQGEAISHVDCHRCDDCGGTGVRTCDRAGCNEAAVVAPCGNADYCRECGERIERQSDLRRFVTSEMDAGSAATLASMLEANTDDEDLCAQLRAMKIGDRLETGGGAWAAGWVVCVEVA